jgi:hypothetical protein
MVILESVCIIGFMVVSGSLFLFLGGISND